MSLIKQYEKDIGGLDDNLLGKIGSDALTTTSDDLSNAINELNENLNNVATEEYVEETVDTDIISNTFAGIASAIRSKAGTLDSFTPSQMASVIENIPGNGSYIKPFTYQNNLSITNYSGDEKLILNNVFNNCYNLSTVSFTGCEYIGEYAFSNCINLTTVSFPKCSYIGYNTFNGCTGLTTVSFPKCKYIGESAFSSCTSLTSVDFPNVSYIDGYAFHSCINLTTISFPNVSTIGRGAFTNCSNITSVIFSNANYIGDFAFQYCYSLASISFPRCKYIGMYAFNNCSSLTTISFPNASYIGNNAFNSCTKLSSLYLLSTSVVSLNNSNAFNNTPLSARGTGKIYVPSNLYTTYRNNSKWKYLSARISSM